MACATGSGATAAGGSVRTRSAPTMRPAAGRPGTPTTVSQGRSLVDPAGGTFPSGSPPARAIARERGGGREDADADLQREPGPGFAAVSLGLLRHCERRARRHVALGGVAISGKTVRLTLASAVTHIDTVRVRYTKPSVRPLRGATGIAVATFGYAIGTNDTTDRDLVGDAERCRNWVASTSNTGCDERLCIPTMQAMLHRTHREDSSCIGGGHDISGHGLSIFRGVSTSSLSWQFRNNLGQSDGPRISGTFHVGNRHMSARRERCPFLTPAIQATPRPGPTAASFSLYLGQLALAGLAAPDGRRPSRRRSSRARTVDGKTLTLTFDAGIGLLVRCRRAGAFYVTVNGARRGVASGGVAISDQTVRLTLTSCGGRRPTRSRCATRGRPSKPLVRLHGGAVAIVRRPGGDQQHPDWASGRPC